MYKVIVDGFSSQESAEEFVNWFEGQGEQNCDIWFECRELDKSPYADMQHEKSYKEIDKENKTVILHIKEV